jgi:glycosyltransferase involved in cell wall biosynthesis
MSAPSLRVALLAGSLTQGGAEKQLLYMARALQQRHVGVAVFTLTRGEFYEAALAACGLPPTWIGQRGNPLLRTVEFARRLRAFRPHLVQATHFFANLHVTLAARLTGAQAIGSLRNDAIFEVEANGRWGRWLLRLPPALIANSHAAVRNAAALGADATRIHVVPNVLDVAEFDAAAPPAGRDTGPVVAMAACRLVSAKRLDRFLEALAIARRSGAPVSGAIVGDGPERPALEQQARTLGLMADGVRFLGRRDDVPALLRRAHMLVVSSDHEGFPNVVLEAMAARLPVITTPAGDAGTIVRDGRTGFVVPFGGTQQLAERIVTLASSADLRQRMGEAGRGELERCYGRDGLAESLLTAYAAIAARSGHTQLTTVLAH